MRIWHTCILRNMAKPVCPDCWPFNTVLQRTWAEGQDSHGGVMIYVKESIYYKRRNDLELRGIECIWIELTLKRKRILFGLFYRPPNSDSEYYTAIADSIHLAADSGIQDIVITGDFNFNMLNTQSSRKVNSICEELSLLQMIQDPTHFIENSSSLIDLIIVSNKNRVINCGVGDSFLHEDIRYHCPIYGILNLQAKTKSFLTSDMAIRSWQLWPT